MNDTTEKRKRKKSGDNKSKETRQINIEPFDNTTPNPPDHGMALGRIFVSGLCVLCFNPIRNRAELGFIKQHHSDLRMVIVKDDGTIFWSSERDFPRPMRDVGITINSTKTGMGLRYENGRVHDEDFDFMPNLAKLHHVEKFKIRPNARTAFSARVDIRDAIFYTAIKSVHDAYLHEIPDSSSTHPAPVNLGKIGKILGADIITEEYIVIEIRYKEGRTVKVHPITLPNDGSKYAIFLITTTPHSGAGHIEFIYNHVIEKPIKASKYDIEFIPPEPAFILHDQEIRATQFACESTGGGEGPLPPFPPEP